MALSTFPIICHYFTANNTFQQLGGFQHFFVKFFVNTITMLLKMFLRGLQ